MQLAYISGFLRTILILVLIYYAVKIIGKYVFPVILKNMMRNVEKKFNQQQQENVSREQSVKEGETIIDKTPGQTKKSSDDVGEYVDYEEVE
ncbi:MAG TPA: DUF4834 family protein [Flavobacteriia bacterium]|jgi:hypothetical protein|nr:DUF4834 family protein [Flavobacteriia bacterium]